MKSGAETILQAFPTARSIWESATKCWGTLEAFYLGKTVVIVQDFKNGDGWEVFVPVTDDRSIDNTLQALAERCGVQARPLQGH